jgi:NADPH:quinone reductase-like Zn-dependent oxidoreductase
MAEAGVLDGLQQRSVARRAPGPGEIELEVRAVGLNFREVLKALDVYAGQEVDAANGITFDGDCAGRVVAVGDGVTLFEPGHDVLGMGYDVFGSYATLPAELFVRKPARMTYEEASTIPGVFLTAYYAMHHLARLAPGESVLIHAAAGGVGLAAVQLAQWAGAEIYATAGREEKRQFLRAMGIRHVMDSRSLDFADEVMRLTAGRGVDVVLNSLAGEYIPKSISVLAPFGRFLEIGKRDIYDNTSLALYPFRRNLSFFAIDVLQIDFPRINRMLEEILVHFDQGHFRPLHHCVFPFSEAVGAFRLMRRAHHIGKVVVTFGDEYFGADS